MRAIASSQAWGRSSRLSFVLEMEVETRGRPRISKDVQALIQQMAANNPTWGQAGIGAELLVKLGLLRLVHEYIDWRPHRIGSGLGRPKRTQNK